MRKARWKVWLKFEPRDLWIGVYWTTGEENAYPRYYGSKHVDVFICLVPCLPIHVRRIVYKEDENGS